MTTVSARRRVWIDIDNPPQVQYLYPFRSAFEALGLDVTVTIREYGNAVELLRQRTSDFHLVGEAFGASKLAKAAGTLGRTRQLLALFRDIGRPDVLLAASRPAALAARILGIPSFIVGDYEFANARFYRYTRSFILHPRVVDPASFVAQGMPPDRLISFDGLKEDVTFAGVDLDAVQAWDVDGRAHDGTIKVLLRPPAERSHYYAAASRDVNFSVLAHLAPRADVTVVYAPRYPEQLADLDRFEWRNPPVDLRHAVPFLPLLKSADVVVCSGGTILREAAYLGIPAYSTFRSRLGDVDRHLESIGRVTIVRDEAGVASIELRKRGPLAPLDSNPDLLEDVARLVMSRITLDQELAEQLVGQRLITCHATSASTIDDPRR
jgi:uncharacterized protein